MLIGAEAVDKGASGGTTEATVIAVRAVTVVAASVVVTEALSESVSEATHLALVALEVSLIGRLGVPVIDGGAVDGRVDLSSVLRVGHPLGLLMLTAP